MKRTVPPEKAKINNMKMTRSTVVWLVVILVSAASHSASGQANFGTTGNKGGRTIHNFRVGSL